MTNETKRKLDDAIRALRSIGVTPREIFAYALIVDEIDDAIYAINENEIENSRDVTLGDSFDSIRENAYENETLNDVIDDVRSIIDRVGANTRVVDFNR